MSRSDIPVGLKVVVVCLMSIIISVSQLGAVPVIEVEPLEFQEELPTGTVSHVPLTISNRGNADLNFNSRVTVLRDEAQNGQRRGEIGTRRFMFQVPHSHIGGLVWDGEKMWATSFDEGRLFSINPQTFEVEENFPIEVPTGGLVWDPIGEEFWMGVWENPTVLRVDKSGEVTGSFDLPRFSNGGFTFDGEFFYWNSDGNPQDNTDDRLYKMTREGEIVGEVTNIPARIGRSRSGTIQWVEKHLDGHFWINTSDGFTTQIEVDFENDEVEVIDQFWGRHDNLTSGITHDGSDLWVAGLWGNLNVYIREDGIDENYWLEMSPASGMLEPDNELEVDIFLNSFELIEGEYEADLHILSNDPENPEIAVNISLNITNAPDIEVIWSRHFGYPENVNWNKMYDDLINGEIYEMQVVIRNPGTEDLVIEDIDFDNDLFFVEDNNFSLQPGESRELELGLDAAHSGLHESIMTLHSNDPDAEEYTVTLLGQSGTNPVIAVDLGEVESRLFTGSTEEIVLNVINEGGVPLRWSVDHEIISEPERDVLGEEIDRFTWTGSGMNQYKCGISWDWDHDWMWLSSYDGNKIAAVDPSWDYEVQVEWNTARPMDNAYFEGILYQIPWSNNRIDLWNTNGELIRSHDLPWRPTAIAADYANRVLLVVNEADWSLRVFSIDDNLREIAIIRNMRQFTADAAFRSMDFINNHYFDPGRNQEGNIWLNTLRRLWLLSIDTENWQVEEVVMSVGRFGSHDWDGVGHDGNNLWLGSRSFTEYRIWGDGVPDHNWLNYSPLSGEILPDRQTEILMMFNATDLVEGEYEADLIFSSNDPENPEFLVPVVLSVEGEACVGVKWRDEYGYPEIMDWNLAFDVINLNETYEIQIKVVNTGWGILAVNGIFFDNDHFTADPTDIVLAPRSEIDVIIRFDSPGAPAEINAAMTVVSDDPDNEEIEVVFHAEMQESPSAFIEPGEILSDIYTDDVSDYTLTLLNLGEGMLEWEVFKDVPFDRRRDAARRVIRRVDQDVNVPGRDDFGQVVGQFHTAYRQMGGLAFDGEYMWGTAYSDRRLFCMTVDNFDVIADFQTEPLPMGVVWDDREGVFWISHWTANELYEYDRQGNLVGRLQMPHSSGGLAFDGDNFYFNSEGNRVLYKTDRAGEVLGQIPNFRGVLGVPRAINMVWVKEHAPGCLWVKTPDWLKRVDVDFEAGQVNVISQFRINSDHGHEGLGHDGYNLWTLDNWENRTGVIYDDGVDETPWITWEPDSGLLAGGDGVDIDVVLDGTDLIGGEYVTDLHFLTNDPDNSDLMVPIIMTVSDASRMVVHWSPEHGYPARIDWNMAHSNLFTGDTYDVEITVENFGSEALEVSDVIFGHESYSADPVEFIVEPGAEQVVTITLDAAEDGLYDSEIGIGWNDPREEDYLIGVRGLVAAPPIIEIDPMELETDLYTDEQVEHIITVLNNGDSPLQFNIDWEEGDVAFEGVPGFSAQYYHTSGGNNPEFRELRLERVDRHINFPWGNAAPGEGVNADNFGVRWTGTFRVPEAGEYRFRSRTDDGCRLYIDGDRVIDFWGGNAQIREVIRQLDPGVHSIMMEMYDQGGPGYAHLYWMPPGVDDWVLMEAFNGEGWITFDSTRGEVPPGEQHDLVLTLRDTELEDGEYHTEAHFLSNDPENPDLVFLIMMFFGAEPMIEVQWSQDHGYPNVIDWNMAHDELFTGVDYEVPITVRNLGDQDLFIMDTEVEGREFDGIERPFFLHPGEVSEIVFSFRSRDAELYEPDLNIVWNSPRDENVVIPMHAEPTPPPVFELGIEELSDDLPYGTEESYETIITNSGTAPLHYSIEAEFPGDENALIPGRQVRNNSEEINAGPQRDNPGQILSNFSSGNLTETIGLAWDPDRELMWGINHNPHTLYAINPANGARVREFDLENHFVSLFYLDGVLYAGGWSNNRRAIYKYDPDGTLLGRIYTPIEVRDTYLECDGERLFMNTYGQGLVRVFDWETLELVGEINYGPEIGLSHTRAMKWIEKHRDGQLWVAGNNRRLYQLHVNEDYSCELIQSFAVPGGDHAGLTHDGFDFWRASYRSDNRIYRIDDGIREHYWLEFSPEIATLEEGDELDFNVSMSAADLEAGEY